MLATTHTLTGAALGIAVDNPTVALGLGVLVHLFLDSLTHWNFYPNRHMPILAFAALDLSTGILLTVALLRQETLTPSVLAGMLGGNLPDLWEFTRYILGLPKSAFDRLHHRLQLETYSLVYGLPSQIVAIGVALLIFTFLRSSA